MQVNSFATDSPCLKRQRPVVFRKYDDLRAHLRIILLQMDDVFVQQSDATFASSPDFDGLAVVGAAVYAYARETGSLKP